MNCFMQVGLDKLASANCKARHWLGLDEDISTSVLKFNCIFSISSGYGRTEFSHTCGKPERLIRPHHPFPLPNITSPM